MYKSLLNFRISASFLLTINASDIKSEFDGWINRTGGRVIKPGSEDTEYFAKNYLMLNVLNNNESFDALGFMSDQDLPAEIYWWESKSLLFVGFGDTVYVLDVQKKKVQESHYLPFSFQTFSLSEDERELFVVFESAILKINEKGKVAWQSVMDGIISGAKVIEGKIHVKRLDDTGLTFNTEDGEVAK